MSNEERLQALVSDFTQKLRAEVEAQVYERLQERLGELKRSGAPAPRGAPDGPKDAAAAPTPKRVMSPAMRKARRLQGQYIGLLRKLDGAKRERVQETARSKGVSAAIELATALRGTNAAAPKRTSAAQGRRARPGAAKRAGAKAS